MEMKRTDYPDESIEGTEVSREQQVDNVKKELSNLDMTLIQIGPHMSSEEIQKVIKKREELQAFLQEDKKS